MSELTPGITRFDPSVVKQLQETRGAAEVAQLEIMNDLASQVIDSGGYCDDKTFSTIFYGGIDPDMNWGDTFTNELLAAVDIPKEFKVALKLGETVSYSCFEPFVAMTSSRHTDDIGIVMPGRLEFEDAIGYEVSRIKRGPASNSITGHMVFMGISKVRDYRPYDEHDLFHVTRFQSVLETGSFPSAITGFGITAVRQYLYPNGYLDNRQMAKLDAHIFDLKLEAKQHTNLARLK